MTRTIMARAPVRNLDLGGWTDIRLFKSGTVLNFAIKLYTHVCLQTLEDDPGIHLESTDIGETEYIREIREIEYGGALDLVKAAISRANNGSGMKITVRSEAPPASGLGSSASLGVALLGALFKLEGKNLLPYYLAREAQSLETEILKLECGVQDQLCAAYGGVSYIEVRYPEASVMAVPISDAVLCELERRIFVVYTGKSHFSSATHKKVIDAFESGDPKIRKAFDNLGKTAALGMEALLEGNMGKLGEAMNMNWENQKYLHPSITTEEIDELEKVCFRKGTIGFKLNGAGAGGTAAILCERNWEHKVKEAIRKEFPTMSVLDAKIDIGRCQGVQAWVSACLI